MKDAIETNMTTRAEPLSEAIIQRLIDASHEVLEELILAPSVEIRHIGVEVMHSPRFDSETPKTSYVVTVDTNDATMVRGAVAMYKGSYKERLEAVLDRVVKQADSTARAYVNIVGPTTPTVDRLIPIRSIVQTKKLSASSPLIKTARRNSLDYIQTRGRHFIAPSPAIAEFLEWYCGRHDSAVRYVADLFAGTAIATKVVLRVGQPERIVTVENDPEKVLRIRQHISDGRVQILSADAMQFSFIEQYDLAIADPYYEDVERFLHSQLSNLRRSVRVLLLVPGNIEDRAWNSHIRRVLEHAEYDVVTHELYGQVIFETRRRPCT